VNKSSNHALNLHRLTSNSSSATDFPWLSPTDNWLNSHSRSVTDFFYTSLLLQLLASEFDSLVIPQHGPHRKHLFCCQNVCLLVCCPALGMAWTTAENTASLLLCNITMYTRMCLAHIAWQWSMHRPQETLLLRCWECMFIGSLPNIRSIRHRIDIRYNYVILVCCLLAFRCDSIFTISLRTNMYSFEN
jgi:hypothetical protein